jgi:hypothetical protein
MSFHNVIIYLFVVLQNEKFALYYNLCKHLLKKKLTAAVITEINFTL